MFDDFLASAAILKIGYATIGILLLVVVSAWLDKRAVKALSAATTRPGEHTFGSALAAIRREPLPAAIYYGARFLAIAVVVAALMGCASASAATFPSKYDRQIKAAVATYWPDYPRPAAWKAQLYQESRLDPAAVSPVGAAGLAQMMPATWAEVTRELRLGSVSPHAEIAIAAGAYYMAKLRHAWLDGGLDDRQRLAQASYNAGLGNIRQAYRRCGCVDWTATSACLPRITGRHAAETITYVSRIARWRAMMEARL